MQAALWYGPEDVRIEEIPVPTVGNREVLVKVGASLTCGTDFKLFRRGHPVLAKTIPAPFGHEMSGTIVEVGSNVTRFKAGDHIVAANSAPCGQCFFCAQSQFSLCDNLEFLTGTYAEYIKIPRRIVEKNLYKIPHSLSFQEAAATEPLACAVHCMDRVKLQANETLCVIGAGPCGLFFVELGKLIGAKVICVGRSKDKLAIAKKLGADHALSVLETKNIEETLKDITPHGHGPDVVIEAAGTTETWEMASKVARKGGRVCFYGGCAKGTTMALDTHRTHYEELSFFGVFHHSPIHFSKAVQLIADGKVDVRPLIAGEKKLKDLGQIFQKGLVENPLKIAVIP